jgi:hypothetical protein
MPVANALRYVAQALKDWGTAQGVAVGYRSLRDPLGLESDEDEKVILRPSAQRSPETRNGQSRHLFAIEFHCMSLRGDLRTDELADRAIVLASAIETEFAFKDIDIYDVVAGDATSKLGSLQFLEARWRNGDQRGTIIGDSVDYTLETPKVEHWVVTFTAALNS